MVNWPTTNILPYLLGQNETLPWDLSMPTTPLTYDYDPTCCTFSNTTDATTNYTYDPGNSSINTGKTDATYNYDDICDLHQSESRSKDKATYADSWVYYYGYRYYIPPLGRWPSTDPLGERGGENLYAFVLNDPLNLWDPFGLESCCDDPCKITNLQLSYHTPPVVMLNATWDEEGVCKNVKVSFWTCTWEGNDNRRRRREGGEPGDGHYGYLQPGEPDPDAGWRDGNMSPAYPGAGNIRYSIFSGRYNFTTIGFKAKVTADTCSGKPGEWETMDPVVSDTGHIYFELIDGKWQITQADVPSKESEEEVMLW